jgi:hypothetical protein
MNKINWNTTEEETPEVGKRVAIMLPDGRVCSGKVTNGIGFELEYIDNMDLLQYMTADADKQNWIYLET